MTAQKRGHLVGKVVTVVLKQVVLLRPEGKTGWGGGGSQMVTRNSEMMMMIGTGLGTSQSGGAR